MKIDSLRESVRGTSRLDRKRISKHRVLLAFGYAVWAGIVASIVSSAPDQTIGRPPAYDQSADMGPHHQAWWAVETTRSATGEQFVRTNRIVRLESGLNYWSGDRWAPSEEIIDLVDGVGAVAQRGPVRAVWAANLNEESAFECVLPDGTRLRSNFLGLSYFDPETQQSVWLAEVHDCVGEVIGAREVHYPRATDRLHCTVRYIYRKGGWSQEVLLLESPPPPESFGLSERTRLEITTEWLEAPRAQITGTIIRTAHGDLVDERIRLGAIWFGAGKAFATADEGPGGALTAGVPVIKEWIQGDRTFLVEGVEYRAIKNKLARLSAAAAAPGAGRKMAAVSDWRRFPGRRLAKAGEKAPFQVASVRAREAGVLIDYEAFYTAENIRFESAGNGLSYWVTGPLTLTGDTVVSPGAIVRVSAGGSILVAGGSFASPEATAYFSSAADAPDGSAVATAEAAASAGPPGLIFNLSSPVVANLEFRGLSPALAFIDGGLDCLIRDCTFRDGASAIYGERSWGGWENISICNVDVVCLHAPGGGEFVGGVPANACEESGSSDNEGAPSGGVTASTTSGLAPETGTTDSPVDGGAAVGPVIERQPSSITVSPGEEAVFTVAASGQPAPSFQWRFNGQPMTGTTGGRCAIADVSAANAGEYDVIVSNEAGAAVSLAAVLTVSEPGALNNGSFESGYSCWTPFGHQTIGKHATDGVRGVIFNSRAGKPDGFLSQSFATSLGQKYLLAYDARGAGGYELLEIGAASARYGAGQRDRILGHSDAGR